MARNLKSFPPAVKKIRPDLVPGLDDWQLMNIGTKQVLDLIGKVKEAGCFDEVRNESARGIGAGDGRLGVVLVPQSKHYSWVKAVDVLGIGNRNLIQVQVNDQYHMDIDTLKSIINDHVARKIPILALVAVVGTTE